MFGNHENCTEWNNRVTIHHFLPISNSCSHWLRWAEIERGKKENRKMKHSLTWSIISSPILWSVLSSSIIPWHFHIESTTQREEKKERRNRIQFLLRFFVFGFWFCSHNLLYPILPFLPPSPFTFILHRVCLLLGSAPNPADTNHLESPFPFLM